MLFSEIIGHQDVKQRLLQSVSEQRVAHAQLFNGKEGIGKLRLAIAYAQYLSCTNRSESDSCGVCPSCVKYAKLAHPDLHFAFPIAKSESKNDVCNDYLEKFRDIFLKNTYFGIDEWMARAFGDSKKQPVIYAGESDEIIKKLNLKSYESEYKVMIIWLPEKMNEACSNKILKILEEPPEKTVFLLVCNQPNMLLPTIISRTQLINIQPLTENDIKEFLLKEKELNIDEENIARIARIANGSALDAFRIASDNEDYKLNLERFTSLMRNAWRVGARKEYDALKDLRVWADELSDAKVGREKQKKFLNYAQRMVRENFILNLQEPKLNYLTIAEENFSRNFAPFIHEKNVENMMLELQLAERQIEQNGYAKIIFFDLALKMIMMLKK